MLWRSAKPQLHIRIVVYLDTCHSVQPAAFCASLPGNKRCIAPPDMSVAKIQHFSHPVRLSLAGCWRSHGLLRSTSVPSLSFEDPLGQPCHFVTGHRLTRQLQLQTSTQQGHQWLKHCTALHRSRDTGSREHPQRKLLDQPHC